jgi:trk system potassium uptake protein TrkH
VVAVVAARPTPSLPGPLLSPRVATTGLSGALLALAVLTHLLVPFPDGHRVAWDHPSSIGAVAVSLALSLSVVLEHRATLLGRLLATAGVVGAAGLWVWPNLERPGWGLIVLLACSWLLTRVWPGPAGPNAALSAFIGPTPPRLGGRHHRAAVLDPSRAPRGWSTVGGTGPLLAVAALLAVALTTPPITGHPLHRRADPWLLAVAGALPAASLGLWAAGVTVGPHPTWAVLSAMLVLLVGRRDEDSGASAILTSLLEHPPRLLVATFAVQCALGGFLLVLPAASGRSDGVSLIDALFTSVSATCVTGLTVLDTAKDFTWVGQLTILGLIQVGGLGIMTFSAAAVLALARRMSVRTEATAADLIGANSVGELQQALVRVLTLTFSIEAAGALALATCFWLTGDRARLRRSGAACSRRSQPSATPASPCRPTASSPTPTTPPSLHIVAALIILGGLGPAVIVAAPGLARGSLTTLHARLAAAVTAALLFAPVPLFAALEWGRSFSHLSPLDRLHNAWFLSVTLRTAGFNTTDLTAVSPATALVMMVLMIIGGSPGSTAGGMKTTTVGVLVLAVRAAVAGKADLEVFGRTVAHTVVYRAGAIATMCAGIVGVATLLLLVTQPLDLQQALFEATSATGTVGLTIGATARLDDIGKLVIMACMFAGRVGPLTLFLLFEGSARKSRASLPVESVPVG